MLDFYASLKGASWDYSAPNVFYSVFKDMNLSKEEYIVYPANVFMFDFGDQKLKLNICMLRVQGMLNFAMGIIKCMLRYF